VLSHFPSPLSFRVHCQPLVLPHNLIRPSPPPLPAPQAGLAFIKDVLSHLEAIKEAGTEEPRLYLEMQVAQYHLVLGEADECRRVMDAGRTALDAMTEASGTSFFSCSLFLFLGIRHAGHLSRTPLILSAYLPSPSVCLSVGQVDPQVSASVHFVAMQYHKQRQSYAAFYRSALQYLCFVSQDTLPQDFRCALAVDVSLAALLGEDVYSFGELLLHPILDALRDGPHQWLLELLQCFSAGDIHAYDALCAKHAALLNAQPAMVEHERRLREKITIACLVELVARCVLLAGGLRCVSSLLLLL
jgi:26S proteasome regulatory subunit N9